VTHQELNQIEVSCTLVPLLMKYYYFKPINLQFSGYSFDVDNM